MKVEILGNNLCDFIHPCDHSILQAVFSNHDEQQQQQQQPVHLAVRVKSLLSEKGQVVSMRQANYKVSATDRQPGD